MPRADRRIRALDATTIDQIAAGEVVERPASVVKELVENALDSGARSVEVTVEQGGLACIAVTDDGCGMAADEVALAVTRHATSKITSVHDLRAVASYGFRGEALSSVASVSRLTLTTRRAADEVGTRIELHGGKLVSCRPCGCPPGTLLEVRELFYNVPARRKFMRAPATEQAYVHDALLRCALGARRGAFRYSAGRRRLLDVPHHAASERRPELLLGRRVRRLTSFVAEAGARGDGLALSGHLSPPLFERAGTASMWLFVNGRFVRDRMLQRAVLEGYQLAFPGQYAAAVVYLDLLPERVDVNVHPQKLEVRFDDAQATFRAVREAVAVWAAKLRALLEAEGRRGSCRDQVAGVAFGAKTTDGAGVGAGPAAGPKGAVGTVAAAAAHGEAGADAATANRPAGWATPTTVGELPLAGSAAEDAVAYGDGPEAAPCEDVRVPPVLPPSNAAHLEGASKAVAFARVTRAAQRAAVAPPRVAPRLLRAPANCSGPHTTLRPPRPSTAPLPMGVGAWQSLSPLGLAPRGYLACRRGNELVLVCLVAAYGAWAARLLAGTPGTPAAAPALHRLLLPPTLELSTNRRAAVDALVAEAADGPSGGVLGVHLQPLGPGRYLVQALPACFADCAPEAVVLALVEASARPSAGPGDRQVGTRVARWVAALDVAGAWPRTYGEGARWPVRLLAALDAGPRPVPMQAPCAEVLSARHFAAPDGSSDAG